MSSAPPYTAQPIHKSNMLAHRINPAVIAASRIKGRTMRTRIVFSTTISEAIDYSINVTTTPMSTVSRLSKTNAPRQETTADTAKDATLITSIARSLRYAFR